jgi:hypothetical protein
MSFPGKGTWLLKLVYQGSLLEGAERSLKQQ